MPGPTEKWQTLGMAGWELGKQGRGVPAGLAHTSVWQHTDEMHLALGFPAWEQKGLLVAASLDVLACI